MSDRQPDWLDLEAENEPTLTMLAVGDMSFDGIALGSLQRRQRGA